MPRTISVSSRQYAAGVYGPYNVDGFTKANTEWLEVAFTVEGWPDASPLITGQALWDTGDGTPFRVDTPLGPDRTGAVRTRVAFRVYVPKDAAGKSAVASGTLTFTAHATLRTAISVTTG